MVLGRRELSVVLLTFGAMFCVYVVLLAGPIVAQSGGGSGLSPGTPARGGNTDNPSALPNMATISAVDCTVEDTGASITLEDGDGMRARFIDGQDVEITATESQIRIEVLNGEFLSDVAEFLNSSDQSPPRSLRRSLARSPRRRNARSESQSRCPSLPKTGPGLREPN